jgi:hypothetical protein
MYKIKKKKTICLLFRRGEQLTEEHRLMVSENRALRRLFGPNREEVTGGWRRLHNEELHNLYASPYITGLTESRRMRWEGHVASMGETEMHTPFWQENLK